jgi:hypothetical protein
VFAEVAAANEYDNDIIAALHVSLLFAFLVESLLDK